MGRVGEESRYLGSLAPDSGSVLSGSESSVEVEVEEEELEPRGLLIGGDPGGVEAGSGSCGSFSTTLGTELWL